MNLTLLERIALGAALVVFTLTLFLLVTSGAGFTPVNLVMLVALAAACGALFLAQDPNNERAALMFWFSAGAWGAAAFTNFQMVGVLQLVVALICAIAAFFEERARREFSFVGPLVLIASAVALVLASNFLSR